MLFYFFFSPLRDLKLSCYKNKLIGLKNFFRTLFNFLSWNKKKDTILISLFLLIHFTVSFFFFFFFFPPLRSLGKQQQQQQKCSFLLKDSLALLPFGLWEESSVCTYPVFIYHVTFFSLHLNMETCKAQNLSLPTTYINFYII